MHQEKLKAAFYFIRTWRAFAYASLLVGCFCALCWMLYTFWGGLLAFNSQWDAKSAACDEQDAFEEQCEQNIEKAKQDFKAYADALPQRIQNIQANYKQELQQFKNAAQQYSQEVRGLATSYNEAATLTESELKRLKNLDSGHISALTVPVQDLNSTADYQRYKNTVQEKARLLETYREQVLEAIMNRFEEYEAPVRTALNEAQRKVDELKYQITATEDDYQRRIDALVAQKRDIPVPSYAARPEKNIYGTTDVEELGAVLDASDALPIMSARLGNASPLTEDGRRNLRKSLLNMTDWLPFYARIYAPTRADIDAVHAHNANIDAQISDLRSEMNQKIRMIQNELYTQQSAVQQYESRMEALTKQKNQLADLSRATTENWEINKKLDPLTQKINSQFPAEPLSPEAMLQREKDLVPQKEKEMQAQVQQLEQSIVSSEEKLDAILAELSAKEREACAAAILQPFPFGFVFGGCADVIEKPLSLITAADDNARSAMGVIPFDFVNDAISSALQKITAIGMAGRMCASVLRGIPFGYIIFGIMLVSAWLGFCILLVVGDYLICPLINATKVQEIAINTRRNDNE